MKADELVAKYVALRERKAELKKKHDAEMALIEEPMKKIEAVILATCNKAGVESIRTTAGTAYVSVRTSCSVADREAYTAWVLDDPHERLVYLDVRANKTAVDQYREECQDLPPGLNWSEQRVVGVRKS